MSSAAFSSSGPRLFEKAPATGSGADAGNYDVSAHTMGAAAAKMKHSRGSFGTGRDSSQWLGGGSSARNNSPRRGTPRGNGESENVTSDLASKVYSSFGGTGTAAKRGGPSAAMGGGSRFAPVKQSAGPGEYYTPPALGASKSANFNKSSNGTMGNTRRFAPVKEAIQGDYSDARPGAFEKSKSQSGLKNTGFGGTAARVTGPAVVAKASTNLSYEGAYAATGAFAKANQPGYTSAAFASRSNQRISAPVPQGPSPGAYDVSAAVSGFSSKSFNKSLASGTGGFGTSARRAMDLGRSTPEDVPGPGEYAPDISDATPREAARPSAAFASTTAKNSSHVRQDEGPSAADYDGHKTDGMGSIKSFNRHVGTGAFGSKAAREGMEKKAAAETPGVGDYAASDPNKKSFDEVSKATRGKIGSAFASTTLRDTGSWVTSGSKFLP